MSPSFRLRKSPPQQLHGAHHLSSVTPHFQAIVWPVQRNQSLSNQSSAPRPTVGCALSRNCNPARVLYIGLLNTPCSVPYTRTASQLGPDASCLHHGQSTAAAATLGPDAKQAVVALAHVLGNQLGQARPSQPFAILHLALAASGPAPAISFQLLSAQVLPPLPPLQFRRKPAQSPPAFLSENDPTSELHPSCRTRAHGPPPALAAAQPQVCRPGLEGGPTGRAGVPEHRHGTMGRYGK